MRRLVIDAEGPRVEYENPSACGHFRWADYMNAVDHLEGWRRIEITCLRYLP